MNVEEEFSAARKAARSDALLFLDVSRGGSRRKHLQFIDASVARLRRSHYRLQRTANRIGYGAFASLVSVVVDFRLNAPIAELL